MTQQDGDDLGVWSEFGTAAGLVSKRVASGLAGGGSGAGEAPGEGSGDGHAGMGDRPDLDGLPPVSGMGDAPATLGAAIGHVTEKVRETAPPEGYRNRVDADGDGHLDKATYRGDGHGGAEILVDLNHDGKTDFVGHDTNLDNRVDFAEYDKDHDGFFEKKMYDDNGDGYLDRAEWTHDS